MKSRNHSTLLLVGGVLILFLAPFLSSTVLSNSASRIVNALSGNVVAAASTATSEVVDSLDGVTHVIEFVKGEPRKPEPGKLILNYAGNIQLKPRFITICVGDSVEFKNNWLGQVNAFSYSKAFKFDTGRNFQPGESRTVGPFPKEGLVRVYDEIHSNVKGFIVVVDCAKSRKQSIKEGEKQARQLLEKEGQYLGEDNRTEDSSNKKGAGASGVSVSGANGLQTATFDTLYGQVIVNLSNDIVAGETNSGSIDTKPKGNTPEEKASNQGGLDDLEIVMDGAKVPANHPTFTWVPPAPETNMSARYPLRLFDTLHGKELVEVEVRMIEVTEPDRIIGGEFPGTPSRPAHPDFLWWPVGQQGRPKEIYGPFDGYFSTTVITIGGQEVRKLAESPRKLVFESPSNVTGLTDIVLKEGNVERKGQYRNVGIKLSALTTTLPKGGSTTVTGVATGVGGSQQPIPIHVECTGQVDMMGGNSQTLQAPPSSDPNATFVFKLQVTATRGTGAFSVTATVMTSGTVLAEVPAGGTPGDMKDCGKECQSDADCPKACPACIESRVRYGEPWQKKCLTAAWAAQYQSWLCLDDCYRAYTQCLQRNWAAYTACVDAAGEKYIKGSQTDYPAFIRANEQCKQGRDQGIESCERARKDCEAKCPR